jgi:hypothetical protein
MQSERDVECTCFGALEAHRQRRHDGGDDGGARPCSCIAVVTVNSRTHTTQRGIKTKKIKMNKNLMKK